MVGSCRCLKENLDELRIQRVCYDRLTGKPSITQCASVGQQFSRPATLEEARCRELLFQNDLFLKRQQAVWQTVALRGCFVSVESRRKSRTGRSQWVGQDNAIP